MIEMHLGPSHLRRSACQAAGVREAWLGARPRRLRILARKPWCDKQTGECLVGSCAWRGPGRATAASHDMTDRCDQQLARHVVCARSTFITFSQRSCSQGVTPAPEVTCDLICSENDRTLSPLHAIFEKRKHAHLCA
ncbi:hypothetical protein MRX96_031408 [Rhipicephalus microplus]